MTDEYIENWLKKAENDLKIVKHELELSEDEIVKDAACFHCQQAVEKYLKAYLIFHKIDFPRTHNIEYLIEQAAKIDNDFADLDVDELSDFGVDIRCRHPLRASRYIKKWPKATLHFPLFRSSSLPLFHLFGRTSL